MTKTVLYNLAISHASTERTPIKSTDGRIAQTFFRPLAFNLYHIETLLATCVQHDDISSVYVYSFPTSAKERHSINKFARFVGADEIVFLCHHPRKIAVISKDLGQETLTPQEESILISKDYEPLIFNESR